MANPAASQHVTSAADVMQIVRGLAPGITAFPIRIHRPNDNHDVPATVKLRDKLKPVVAIRGHSRDVALDNMLSTAMKVKGDPCSQTSPAPALSPTSATVPTPTPAPATAPCPHPTDATTTTTLATRDTGGGGETPSAKDAEAKKERKRHCSVVNTDRTYGGGDWRVIGLVAD